jgi:hypothetical protein
VPTRPGQSKALLDELLAGQDPVAVEAAIARLAIIGRPALRQVLQRLASAEATDLPRLLRVTERIGDPGSLAAVRSFLTHDVPEVALAAVDAVGTLLDARDASVASGALDALTTTLLDASRGDTVRLRAFEAIANAPAPSATYDADVVEPLRQQLRRDRSEGLRAAMNTTVDAAPTVPTIDASGEARLGALGVGELADDPEHVRQQLVTQGATLPLTTLHRVIERIREHESGLEGERQEQWRVVRATAHLALATRGSRLAVYDLRETLEALGDQTPVGMLSALQQVGDASVLDALADAYQGTANPWFRGQLTGIFRAVVEREKLTKRQAAVKKLAARLPDTLNALWG